MPSLNRAVSVLTGLCLAPLPCLAAAPTVATFNTGPEGFVGSTTSTTLVHSPSSGNPGGHIQIRKSLSPPVFDIGAADTSTPAFLGDYAAGGITGAGFDLNVFNTTLTAAFVRFRPDIFTNGWSYDFGAVNPNSNLWSSFLVNFDPTWSDATAISTTAMTASSKVKRLNCHTTKKASNSRTMSINSASFKLTSPLAKGLC